VKDAVNGSDIPSNGSFSGFSGFGNQESGTDETASTESGISGTGWTGFGATASPSTSFGSFNSGSMGTSASEQVNGDVADAGANGDEATQASNPFGSFTGFGGQQPSEKDDEEVKAEASPFAGFAGFGNQEADEKDEVGYAADSKSSDPFSAFPNGAATQDGAGANSPFGDFGTVKEGGETEGGNPFSAFSNFGATKDETEVKDAVNGSDIPSNGSFSGFSGFGNQESGTDETASTESGISGTGWTGFGATASPSTSFGSFNSGSMGTSASEQVNGDVADAGANGDEATQASSPFGTAQETPFSGFTGFGNQEADEKDEVGDEADSKSDDETMSSDPFSAFSNSAATQDGAGVMSTFANFGTAKEGGETEGGNPFSAFSSFGSTKDGDTKSADFFSAFSDFGSTTEEEIDQKDTVKSPDSGQKTNGLKPGASFSSFSAFDGTKGKTTTEESTDNGTESANGEDTNPAFSGFTDYGDSKDKAQAEETCSGVCDENDTTPAFSGLTDYGAKKDKLETGDNVIDVDAEESKPAFSGITDYGDTKDDNAASDVDSEKKEKKAKPNNNPFSIFSSFGMPKGNTRKESIDDGAKVTKKEDKAKSGGFFSGFMNFGTKKTAKNTSEANEKTIYLPGDSAENEEDTTLESEDICAMNGEEKINQTSNTFFADFAMEDSSETEGATNSTMNWSSFGSSDDVDGQEKIKSEDDPSSAFKKFTGSATKDSSITESNWSGFGSSVMTDNGNVNGEEKAMSTDEPSSVFEKFTDSATKDSSSTGGKKMSGFGNSVFDSGNMNGEDKVKAKDDPSSAFKKFTGSATKDSSLAGSKLSGFQSSASDTNTGNVNGEEKTVPNDEPSSTSKNITSSVAKDSITTGDTINSTMTWSSFGNSVSTDSNSNSTAESKVEGLSSTPFATFTGLGNQEVSEKKDISTDSSSSFSSSWSGFNSFSSTSVSIQNETEIKTPLSNFTGIENMTVAGMDANTTGKNTSNFSPAWSGFDSFGPNSAGPDVDANSDAAVADTSAEKNQTKPVPTTFSNFLGLGVKDIGKGNATADFGKSTVEPSPFAGLAELSDEGDEGENITVPGQFLSAAMDLNDQENTTEVFAETDLDEKPAVRVVDDYRNDDVESSPFIAPPKKYETEEMKNEATPLLLDPKKAKELNKRAAELLSDEDLVLPTPIELNFADFASTMLYLDSTDDAKKTLETMERVAKFARELDDANCTAVPPGNEMYNLVIKSYAKDSRKAKGRRSNYLDDGNSVLMAEALLYQMQMSEYENLSPNVETYSSVLECWANSMNVGDYGVSRAEELLQILIEQDNATTQTYNSVILAHLRANRPSSVEKANTLLSRMEELYNVTKNEAIKPDTLSYTATINCLAKSTSEVDLQQGIEWVKRMKTIGVDPNIRTFVGIVKCIAAYYQRLEIINGESDELNSELIHQLKATLSSMKDFGVRPNVYVYGLILDVLSKKSTPEQTVNVLNIMSKNGVEPNAFCYSAAINSYVYSDLPPDEIVSSSLFLLEQCPLETRNSVMYTGVINAFTRLAPYYGDAAMEATRLHNSMINSYKRTKLQEFKPTTLSYSALINCWAKSRAWNRLEIAKSIYNELEQWYQNTGNDPDLAVTTVASNALLDAFARSATKTNSHAWECQLELQKMAQPDVRSYGAVILAYANTGTWDASLNATKLVDVMVRQGIEPNDYTYTSVFSALSKSFRPNVKDRTLDITLKLMNEMNAGNVNKNVQLCTAIFDVLGKCGDIGTIMKVYKHMVEDLGVLPTPATHQVLVSSFLNNNSFKLAEDYLKEHFETMSIRTLNLMLRHFSRTRQMGKLRDLFYSQMLPDRVNELSYTTFINALSKSANEKTAFEAEQLVQEMYTIGIVQPNLFTYNALLNTWLKSGSPQAPSKCVEILQIMESHGIEPDKISYTCYIGAWAKTKPEQGMRILEYVEDSNLVQLDRVPYFSLINAFAIENNVDMVMKLVQRMKNNGIDADKRLYDVIVNAIDRSNHPQQRKKSMKNSIPYAVPQKKKKKFSFL